MASAFYFDVYLDGLEKSYSGPLTAEEKRVIAAQMSNAYAHLNKDQREYVIRQSERLKREANQARSENQNQEIGKDANPS
jgi:hypothetical protein